MIPSLSVLPALAPTLGLALDADPPLALIDDASDRHIKRLHRSVLPGPSLPFGLTTLVPVHPTSITIPIPTAHAGDSGSECTLLACRSATPGQWTGVAIRAIVPLPRRVTNNLGSSTCTPKTSDPPTSASASTDPEKDNIGPPRSAAMRFAHYIWDDDDDDDDEDGDTTDSDAEDREDVELGEEDKDEDEDDLGSRARAQCCSYESITATEGLSARSFEELRVECYAQSLIARGTKPPPVVQPSLAIPPAFVPRIVRRS